MHAKALFSKINNDSQNVTETFISYHTSNEKDCISNIEINLAGVLNSGI